MHDDCHAEAGVLGGLAGAYCDGGTVRVAFFLSQLETGLVGAVTYDFSFGGKGGGCSDEGCVVPEEEGGSESRDILQLFVNMFHEEGKEGIGYAECLLRP